MFTIQCSLDLPFFKGVEKTIDECGETRNPENHFFLNKKSRTLSFASWQNFASIENMTFWDLKCVHGPHQLYCVHSKTLQQLSTKRIICLFWAPICVSKEWRNEQNISVVIHALLFAWYLIGNFLTSLKHLGFEDFPITIGTCLSLPSLLTHSSTVSLSLECFPPWQVSPLYAKVSPLYAKVSPLYAKVLSGSTLKNSPVSSALYTSRGS
jgi:hypothetical protein